MNVSAYNKISSLCSRKEMCCSDAKNYLRKFKELSEQDKQEIIDSLVDEKFIDEERFAKAFVNDSYKYNKWGKNKIIYTLRAKNIPESIITSAINTIDEEIYKEIKESLAKNKRDTLEEDDPAKENKVNTFLRSKGF
ncbi:MAG: RecX family transcriptional regulator [Bacteroidales bacterium]|jgi:regulatory protein|nr:RecX family transcriptional regulator [Bacteroidales bacterium]